MATDNVYKLTVNGVAPVAGLQQNVAHYRLETAPTHTDYEMAQDLANTWNGINRAHLTAMMGTNCSLESLSAERVTLTGGPTANLPSNHVGTAGAECWDSALAMCIGLIPGAPPYRRKLGKWFVWGLPDGALFENVWDPGFLVTVDNFASTLVLPMPSVLEPANNWLLVIYDRHTKVAADVKFESRRLRPSHLKRRQRPYPV